MFARSFFLTVIQFSMMPPAGLGIYIAWAISCKVNLKTFEIDIAYRLLGRCQLTDEFTYNSARVYLILQDALLASYYRCEILIVEQQTSQDYGRICAVSILDESTYSRHWMSRHIAVTGWVDIKPSPLPTLTGLPLRARGGINLNDRNHRYHIDIR